MRRRRGRRAPNASMTVMEHLGELRTRLIISAVAFIVTSIVAFFFYEPILEFMRKPLCELETVDPELLGPQGCDLVFIKVLGGFLFRLKVTALVGIMFAAPVWLYQLWAFIVPALTVKERRLALPFVASSVALFATGFTFAYLTLPTGIRVLITIAGEGLVPLLGAEEYLNFVGLMMLGFGIAFELPLLLFFLGLAGVVTVEQLRRQRKGAIVGITALAAIVTPSQDPYTLFVLAVPLYLLFEVTIALLALVNRRRARRPV